MSKIRKNGAWVDKSLAKKRVNGAWVDADKDYYVRTPNISGVPPFTFKSDGEDLRDWSMAGQSAQTSGTTTYPAASVTVRAIESGTNYAMFNLADFPDVVVGDKITVNVGGTNYTLAVKKVDSTYVYVENREV